MSRVASLPVVLTIACTACLPAAVNLRDVQRVEIEGRFVWGAPGRSPTVRPDPVVLEGARLQALVDAARCRAGTVLWKGGIPAVLVMRDGSRVRVDGFSFYGGFLRVHRKQWCEFADDAWVRIWQARWTD